MPYHFEIELGGEGEDIMEIVSTLRAIAESLGHCPPPKNVAQRCRVGNHRGEDIGEYGLCIGPDTER